jgi:hypothetical protein
MVSLKYVIASRKAHGNIPPLGNTEECSRPSQYSAEDVATDSSAAEDEGQAKENEGNIHSQSHHRLIKGQRLAEKCPPL